ncbi:MAG TPA: hypothetical protein VNN80_30820 [Polyangiaceae bacterium]|nr:hypothetical protein [Polyangiaceae bacterium]
MSLRTVLFLLALVATSLSPSKAHAYAWMIRHGFSECQSCHVDPMGGETLTGMGRVMGQTLMTSQYGGQTPSDAAMFLYGIQEPDNVRLGGSFRGLSIYDFDSNNPRVFPMQMDLYGAGFIGNVVIAASFGVSRASARYEHSSKAKLFGDIEDEGFIGVSRNHWLGYRFSDQLMLRAGRINLPFGVRTPDHVMWVRSETLTDRESDQQHGISIVYSDHNLRGELMGSVGNFQMPREFRAYGYSGFLEYSLDTNLALGVSSLVLYSQKEPLTIQNDITSYQREVVRQAHGLTARYVPFELLVILAEADLIKRNNAGFGYVGMGTADLEPVQGLHFALTGEVLNRGKPDAEDLGETDRQVEGPGRGETRLGVWGTINWFFLPHLDLRFDVVARQDRATMLQSQLHFYF